MPLDYESRKLGEKNGENGREPVKPAPRKQFDPLLWAFSDCRVKECVNGLIFFDSHWKGLGDYGTIALCPACDRGLEFIPSLPRYRGAVTYRSDDEMDARKEHRIAVVTDDDYRLSQAKELLQTLEKIAESKDSGG